MRTGLVPNTTRSIVLPICRRSWNSCQTTSKNKTYSYAEMPVKWLHIRVSLPLLSLSVVHTSLLLPSASASAMSVSVLVTQFFLLHSHAPHTGCQYDGALSACVPCVRACVVSAHQQVAATKSHNSSNKAASFCWHMLRGCECEWTTEISNCKCDSISIVYILPVLRSINRFVAVGAYFPFVIYLMTQILVSKKKSTLMTFYWEWRGGWGKGETVDGAQRTAITYVCKGAVCVCVCLSIRCNELLWERLPETDWHATCWPHTSML